LTQILYIYQSIRGKRHIGVTDSFF